MSRNLLEKGFQLAVHNRSRAKVDEMAALGATPASSPGEVTKISDVVLTCLPDVPTVEQIFLGDNGIVANSAPGQILVDHSTIDPPTAQKITKAAESTAASFLDAPVSGFPVGAARGTLTIMVGGDEFTFGTALPVFQAMGSNIQYVGPTGAGSSMKLVNQLMLLINTLGAVEGFLLGAKLGVDPQLLLETIGKSSGQSVALSMMGPLMMNRDFSDEIGNLGAAVKDIKLLNDVAAQAGVPIHVGAEASRLVQSASTMGLEQRSVSALLQVLARMSD
ncbi:MAG: NAD(P)-dependent oxidoreductase [Chloroflexi bacterium]|nr:NAD(P)-dependent oxidoreductase [Chloroflexota bacterium]